MKILLVEDEEALNRLLCYNLEKKGDDVRGFFNGNEVLEYLEKDTPELMLIDYGLPDMDGQDLIEIIKTRGYDIPFVIITGRSDITIAIDMMKMGAIDFVVKDENFNDIFPITVEKAKQRVLVEKQKKQFQEEIIRKEELYRNMVNQIPDPIFYYSGKKFLFVNDTFKEILGYDEKTANEKLIKDEHIAKTLSKINTYFHENREEEVHPVFEFEMKTQEQESKYFLLKAIKTDFGNQEAIMVVLVDITEKKQFESRLRKSIIETEEKEHIRFARDLHDELGPLLSGIKLYTNLLSSGKKSEKEEEEIQDKIVDLIDTAVKSTRNISNNLIPSILVDFGLDKAVTNFIEKLEGTVDTVIFYTNTATERLEKNIEITLYRVIKELINNSLKYSGAENIDIQIIEKADHLHMFYEDDGKGFDVEDIQAHPEKAGSGLRNIKNRLDMIEAGYYFESQPDEGFAFAAKISS